MIASSIYTNIYEEKSTKRVQSLKNSPKYQTNSTDDLFWKRARVIAKNEEEYVRIIFCPFFQYIIYSWFF